MLLQFDCWESPDRAQVVSAKAANPSLYAFQGYVPGWGAPYGGGWSAQAVLAVLGQGLGYLPLLVPSSGDAAKTPQDAQGWDQAVIFGEHHVASGGGKLTVLGLNVEAPWSAANLQGWRSAALAFAAACKRSGVASVVYGSAAFLASLATTGAPTIIYPGEWPNGAEPPSGTLDLAQIPGIPDSEWSGPGQRIWQYQGGHSVAGLGVQVDASLTSSDVPYCRPVAQPTPDPTPATDPTVPTALSPGTYTVTAGATIVIN